MLGLGHALEKGWMGKLMNRGGEGCSGVVPES